LFIQKNDLKQPFYQKVVLLRKSFLILTRNPIPMKRKILYAAAFLFIAWAATSCEALNKNCKFCKMVMTDKTTGDVTEGNETEYCGAELVAIEAKGSWTTGNQTVVWQCR
jgi:hypothetical protein